MIEIPLHLGIILYLTLALAVILALWLRNHWQTRHRTLKIETEALYLCEFCHCVYLESRMQQLNRCPQCNSLNRNNNYR
jgi:uncharacterized paraquat-inducible protein A